jgi:predicted acyltransferase
MAAVAGLAVGLLLQIAGVCPIVKRIWTPAWTLFSGGLCFLLLAGFCWIIEVKRHRKWAFPLIVIGMNSVAAYFLADYFGHQIADAFSIHLGATPFLILGTKLALLTRGAVQLLSYWLILFWMYRRKVFLRI